MWVDDLCTPLTVICFESIMHVLKFWLIQKVRRDGTLFIPQYAMRKDHRHILMSDWDFRFVSYDMPDCGVGGFEYKASNLEGKPNTAARNDCWLADTVDTEGPALARSIDGS